MSLNGRAGMFLLRRLLLVLRLLPVYSRVRIRLGGVGILMIRGVLRSWLGREVFDLI
jgi:hypothetical protein